MWKQTNLTTFTNGSDVIRLDCYGLTDFTVSKNDMFEETLPSFDALNNYLKENGLPTIILPTKVNDVDTWFEFDGYTCETVFSRKRPDGTTQTVSVDKFSDDVYSVYEWCSNYSDINYYAQMCFEFVEDLNKTPCSDLELDAYIITLHGASGMDVCHRYLEGIEDVKEVLKTHYGIILK